MSNTAPGIAVPLEYTAREHGKGRRALIAPSGKNHFNTIRLAMALLVIWSHSFAILLGSERTEWVSLLLGGTFNAGNIGVMGFFIISGFLIAQSWERSSSLLSYMNKRVRRIYPGYIVATIVSGATMMWYVGSGATLWAWAKAIALNLLLRNYAPVANSAGAYDLTTVNGALWSISFEFWCYIGVVALGIAGLTSRRWALLALLVSVVALHVGLDLLGRKPGLGMIGVIFGWPYLWTKIAPCFLVGMVGYAFRKELPRSRIILVGLFLATVLACNFDNDLAFVLSIPSLAYAIFYVAHAKLPLPDAARYGDFSYGAYLYGFLIQKSLQATIATDWTVAEFFFTSAVLAITAGCASWYCIERRFIAKKAVNSGHEEPRAALAGAW